MTIRTYAPGDELAQVGIYNEATATLPKFKAATVDEVRRRCLAADFDPATRLFALRDGRPVAYAGFHASGRVGFPWCRKGHEALAEPLLAAVLDAMRRRGHTTAWAAYRADWLEVGAFFTEHGFRQTREVLNWVMDLVEMPTPAARVGTGITPVEPADVPALFRMAPTLLRARSEDELARWLFQNPYFGPDACSVLRSRVDGQPLAAAVLVADPAYAHPRQVDAAMPCFRLGAFGTEGLTTKRINGLFSLLVPEDGQVGALGLDLLGHAARRLEDCDAETLAAQVPSDVPHLVRFHKQYFRRQGSFPLYERAL
jgi:hypothetical protein